MARPRRDKTRWPSKRWRSSTEAHHTLQRFAYVCTHHLHEPLATLSGYVRLFHRRYKGKVGGDGEEFLRYILGSAKQMESLLQDLRMYLSCSREQVLDLVNLKVLVAECLNKSQGSRSKSLAQVTFGELPWIIADGDRLREILMRLFQNALKFRGHQPACVHIAVEPYREKWLFAVRDNGIGIEHAYAKRIFELFERLERGDRDQGTGTGLAVCKKLVEDSGGQIWVDSHPGAGSVFYFTIPSYQTQHDDWRVHNQHVVSLADPPRAGQADQ